jgi:hypothetical protein
MPSASDPTHRYSPGWLALSEEGTNCGATRVLGMGASLPPLRAEPLPMRQTFDALMQLFPQGIPLRQFCASSDAGSVRANAATSNPSRQPRVSPAVTDYSTTVRSSRAYHLERELTWRNA